MQIIIDHVATVHPDQIPRGPREQRVRPPPLVRPTVDIGCSPAQWADFLTRWTRFRSGCNITATQLTTQAMECFSEKLISTADKAVHNIEGLDLDNLLHEVKESSEQRLTQRSKPAASAFKPSWPRWGTLLRTSITSSHAPTQHRPPVKSGVALLSIYYLKRNHENRLLVCLTDESVKRVLRLQAEAHVWGWLKSMGWGWRTH